MGTFYKLVPFTLHPAGRMTERLSHSFGYARARSNLFLQTKPAIRVCPSDLFASKFVSATSRSFASCPIFDIVKPYRMDSCSGDSQTKKRPLNDPEVDNAIPTMDLMTLAHNQTKLLKSTVASPQTNVFRIIVEGNIGSGKTTFLKIFAKNCTDQFNKPLIVPEPIDLWRDVGGENVFQLLGDDPERWSFAFQSYVQLTMMKIHEMIPKEGNVKVMERSLYSARYCFVENLRNKGLLRPMEYSILDQWFQFATKSESTDIDLIIYLRSDPDIVYKRIKARGRPEEAGLSLDYLRALHELHEDWLVRGKYPLNARVLSIDANTPLDQIVSVYEEKTDAVIREHIAVMAQ